jgi:hypothetical protein
VGSIHVDRMHVCPFDAFLENVSIPITVTILTTEDEFYRRVEKLQC